MPFAKSRELYRMWDLDVLKPCNVMGVDLKPGQRIRLCGNDAYFAIAGDADPCLAFVRDAKAERAEQLAAELEELSKPTPRPAREEFPPAATTSDTNAITGRGMRR